MFGGLDGRWLIFALDQLAAHRGRGRVDRFRRFGKTDREKTVSQKEADRSALFHFTVAKAFRYNLLFPPMPARVSLVCNLHRRSVIPKSRAWRWPTYWSGSGFRVDFPERQTCCGQPAFNSGYREEARQVARHFLDVFSRR